MSFSLFSSTELYWSWSQLESRSRIGAFASRTSEMKATSAPTDIAPSSTRSAPTKRKSITEPMDTSWIAASYDMIVKSARNSRRERLVNCSSIRERNARSPATAFTVSMPLIASI